MNPYIMIRTKARAVIELFLEGFPQHIHRSIQHLIHIPSEFYAFRGGDAGFPPSPIFFSSRIDLSVLNLSPSASL